MKVQITQKAICFQWFFDIAYRIFYTMATAIRTNANGTVQTRFLRFLIAHPVAETHGRTRTVPGSILATFRRSSGRA